MGRSKAKEAAAAHALQYIQDHMLVGLGTGSTSKFFIDRLSERVKRGLKVTCAASSLQSWNLAVQSGLTMIDMQRALRLDITIDGADQIDKQGDMLKGGGGALLREKILASASDQMIAIVDSSKLVERLGSFPLAVEIVDFGLYTTISQIKKLGLDPTLRQEKGQLYQTDGGNRIVDVDLLHIERGIEEIERDLLQIAGVISTGFFKGFATKVVVGREDGTVNTWIKKGKKHLENK